MCHPMFLLLCSSKQPSRLEDGRMENISIISPKVFPVPMSTCVKCSVGIWTMPTHIQRRTATVTRRAHRHQTETTRTLLRLFASQRRQEYSKKKIIIAKTERKSERQKKNITIKRTMLFHTQIYGYCFS